MEVDIHYASFEEYEGAMQRKGQPVVIIVGCGHGEEYKHKHTDCWCVNKEEDKWTSEFKQAFKEKVQYDEILDIASYIHDTRFNKDLSDVILHHKNRADVVLLEQPTYETLCQAWTIYNAVSMLKVLIIEHPYGGYSFCGKVYEEHTKGCIGLEAYRELKTEEKVLNNKLAMHPLHPTWLKDKAANEKHIKRCTSQCFFLAACLTDELQMGNYQAAVKTEKFQEKLNRYLVNSSKTSCYNTMSMAHYLARWYMVDIINLERAYQPYANRKNTLISATKTQETENAMEDWAKKIMKGNMATHGMHLKSIK